MSPNDAQGNATAPKTATILIPRGSSPRALYNELTADLLARSVTRKRDGPPTLRRGIA